MKVILTLYTGEVREFATTSNSFTVGRSAKSDIKIEMEGISRQHCLVEINDLGDIYITDLNSTNGVLIDGHKIEPGKKVLYNTFLNLSMGPILSFQFERDDKTVSRYIPQPQQQIPKIPKQNATVSVRKTSPLSKEKESTIKKKKNDFSFSGLGILVSILILAGFFYAYYSFRFSEDELSLPLSKDSLIFE